MHYGVTSQQVVIQIKLHKNDLMKLNNFLSPIIDIADILKLSKLQSLVNAYFYSKFS